MAEVRAVADGGPAPRSDTGTRATLIEWIHVHEQALGVGVVAAIALVLGLVRLGSPSLWVDEGYTAHAAHRSPRWWFAHDQYHVLYDGLAKIWTTFAGTSEFALRLPSVFGSMAAGVLLVLLGRKMFDRWTSLLAGVFLVTSPFVVQWSQQARGYTIALSLSLVATLVLLWALERSTRGAWALYGVVVSAVVVWHVVVGLLLVPAHLVLIAQKRRRFFPHGPLAALIFLAIAAPWAATIAMRTTGRGVGMNWLKAPTPTVVGHALLDVSGVAGLGLALALVGLLVLWRRGIRDRAAWLGVWAFAPFAVSLLPSAMRPIFLDRYLIVAAPAFALLASVAVTGIGRRLRSVAGLAAVVATSFGLLAWYSTTSHGNWHGEDWRSAVATVLRREHEADAVVVADWSAAPAAEYYGAPATDTSTAASIWVLRWSETGRPLTMRERRSLGFGDSRLVESIPYGRRLSLQLWRKAP